MIMGHYRPFTKKYLQYQTDIIERPSRYKSIFGEDNQVIYVTGNGIDFSTLVTDKIPNLHFMNTGQGFYKKIMAQMKIYLMMTLIFKLTINLICHRKILFIMFMRCYIQLST